MSDIAIGRGKAAGQFSVITVAVLLGVGILSFIGMLVLGAYAPDMKSGRNGGAHALSTAATGFSGIVALARGTGREPQIIRNEALLQSEDLLVVTPERGAAQMDNVLKGREHNPTLIVLPKWDTVGDKDHQGWVRYSGLKWHGEAERVMAPAWKYRVWRHPSAGKPLSTVGQMALTSDIHFTAPRPLQVLSGEKITPLITDGAGGTVLGQMGDGPLYILSDPDLLSNKGMRSEAQAAAALEMLDWLNSTGAESIGFDVTLNGFGKSPSPLKLMFDPPFVAMTIALAITLLLAGLQALVRFGPVLRRARAIAFGKAALVDNTASLVRKAGREAGLGARFADVVRERAVLAFGVPARLKGAQVDAYLDKLSGNRKFTDLAAAAANAQDRHALLAAARALYQWKREKSR